MHPSAAATIRQRNPAKPMAAVVCGIAEAGIPARAGSCEPRQGKPSEFLIFFADTNPFATCRVNRNSRVSRTDDKDAALPSAARLRWPRSFMGEDQATPSFTSESSARSFPFGAATAVLRHGPVERSYSSRLTNKGNRAAANRTTVIVGSIRRSG